MKIKLIRRSSYLLLEAVIALTLLFTCALKFIINPIENYRVEIKNMHRGDYERVAQLSFAEIKEKLYKHELSYKELGEKKTYSLPDVDIQLTEETPLQIRREYTLTLKSKEVEKGRRVFGKVMISLKIYPINNDKEEKDYTFFCFLTKII